MTGAVCFFLAVLSIWDYPSRFPEHCRLRRQFVSALRAGDAAAMQKACRAGVELLPDDPTWHYNLACSLARISGREDAAFDELEVAIDLGYRNRESIEKDPDLSSLKRIPRYKELLEYADFMKTRPILTGPMATVDATGEFGRSIALGEQNLGWDFDVGCFVARLNLSGGKGGNAGDLYMNRDDGHSTLRRDEFPGLTRVTFDSVGTNRSLHLDIPNVLFPYPTFGNCSRAMPSRPQGPQGPYNPFWRSMPRMLMTAESGQLGKMARLYLSNQTWVFPANEDIAPVGTNGDVFASIAPYWMTTAGRSWSDLPYLRAALEASRALKPSVKAAVVKRGLLAPTIQTLIRKSLKSVSNEVDYVSAKAHPTVFPPNGVDLARLKAAAAALTVEAIPPLAAVVVASEVVRPAPALPELTYASGFAWAFVLRAEQKVRTFRIAAKGAAEFSFVQTHGAVGVTVEREKPNVAKITIDRTCLSPTNRVDITVVGRNSGTGWGAPSYVCFSRLDPSAPYSDPVLAPAPEKKAE